MTEEQHIALVEVGNTYFHAFGKIVAEAVNALPPEMERDALAYLQGISSVYGSCYRKYVKADREKKIPLANG